VTRQLVPESNVPGFDLEQLSSLRLLGRRGPARHHHVENRGVDAVRNDRDQLYKTTLGVVQPGSTTEDRVRDRGRQVICGSRSQQLRHVERVAPRCGVHVVRVVSREGGDCDLRQRRELDEHRVIGTDRAYSAAKRMRRRRIAAAKGENEQRWQ
jgi:hypothetical protein